MKPRQANFRLTRPALVLLVATWVLASAASAFAAVPPLEAAEQRQASLRKEAAGQKIDVSLTVTADQLESHDEPGVVIGSGERLTLGDAIPSVPAKLLSALLTADDPLSDIQERLGGLDAANTSIETLDGAFIYVWGSSPGVAMSRDLGRIRRVAFESNEHTWEVRLSGKLDMAGLPERVHVLRSGEPFATLELERARPEPAQEPEPSE